MEYKNIFTYKKEFKDESGYVHKTETRIRWGVLRNPTLLLIIFMLIWGSVFVNTEYEKSIVTRFGKIHSFDEQGIHFKLPFIDTNNRADTRLEEINITTRVAMKGGTNIIGVKMTFNHSISREKAVIEELYRTFGSQYDYESRLFSKLAVGRVKAIIGKNTIEGFIDKRDKVRAEAQKVVSEVLGTYGIQLHGVQFSEITFPDKYIKVLEGVAVARAAAAKSEQQARQEEFLKKKNITKAEGDNAVIKLAADAEAYKIKVESIESAANIERVGVAKAKAIREQNEAAKQVEGLADLKRAEAMKNWDGSVPQIFNNGSSGGNSMFPFLNMNKILDK